MKTRLGFISNSSSSSFIVALQKMFESVDECMTFFDCYREQAERIFKGLSIHTYVANDVGTRDIIKSVFDEYGQWNYIAEQLTGVFIDHNAGKCMGVVTFDDEDGDHVDFDLRSHFRQMLQNKGLAHLVVRN